MPDGFLDGIEVAFTDSTPAGAEIGSKIFSFERSVGKRGPAHDFREGFSAFFCRSKLFVGIQFESNGLGCHAQITHELERAARQGRVVLARY